MDAEKLAGISLKIPDFEKAQRFVLIYLEGLKALYDIDIEDELIKISKIDRRFIKGNYKEIIFLKTEQFNPNGTIYLGKTKMTEIKYRKLTGILYLY